MLIPLVIDSGAVGALNIYNRRAHALTAQDQARAQQFAIRPRARSPLPGS